MNKQAHSEDCLGGHFNLLANKQAADCFYKPVVVYNIIAYTVTYGFLLNYKNRFFIFIFNFSIASLVLVCNVIPRITIPT